MDFLAVALITNGGRMDKGENRSDLMPNITVAICAFDLVVGNMILMHELRGIFGPQYLGFFMTLSTFPLRDMTISLNDINMAFFAGYPSFNILPMIEAPTFNFNVSFGLNMTGGTTTDGARNTFLFPSLTSPVVMTDETIGFVNGEVGSLDELCMTGGASKFNSPSQLAQMFSM
jgi:hypothetical protein